VIGLINFKNGSSVSFGDCEGEPLRGIGSLTFWDDEKECLVTIECNHKEITNVTYWNLEEENQ
jgi:hypothetical protein